MGAAPDLTAASCRAAEVWLPPTVPRGGCGGGGGLGLGGGGGGGLFFGGGGGGGEGLGEGPAGGLCQSHVHGTRGPAVEGDVQVERRVPAILEVVEREGVRAGGQLRGPLNELGTVVACVGNPAGDAQA